MKESVTIDGVKYVPEVVVNDDYVIIRTRSAGVFAGLLVKRNGQEAEMKNARRLWYWSGAASLSQLAIDGVSDPVNCKFPCEVPSITVMEVIEVIPCTVKAMSSIRGVGIWKR